MKLSGARILCFVLALQFAATSCLAPAREAPLRGDGPAIPAELARVLSDYETAWEKKDAVALSLLFAEDGFVLSSGNPAVRGRAAIAKHYESSGGPLALHAIAWAAHGEVAYILGGYGREAGADDIGKFTLTLRKGADGRWLIASDMDNSNRTR